MNSVSCTCPHCSHTMQLPQTLVGKQGKCPSCGQMMTVQQSLGNSPLATPPLPSGSTAQPGTSPMDTAKAFSSAAGNTAKKIFGQAAQSLRTSDSFSRGNDRYPNLSKYLTLSELLIKIFYIIGLVVLVLGLAVVAFYLVPALTAQEGFLIGLAALVGSIVVGALYFLFLWLWRMTALATMEFVRVIMDIEQNTRNS